MQRVITIGAMGDPQSSDPSSWTESYIPPGSVVNPSQSPASQSPSSQPVSQGGYAMTTASSPSASGASGALSTLTSGAVVAEWPTALWWTAGAALAGFILYKLHQRGTF